MFPPDPAFYLPLMHPRQHILASALHLFMRHGVKSVTMDDLAAEMHISKKTIYKWFSQKDELVHDSLAQYLGAARQEFDQQRRQSATAIDELLALRDWLRRQFADVGPAIFYDLQKYYPSAWALWLEHKNGYTLRQIGDNLHRGIREGLFRPELDVAILSRLRLAQVELAFSAECYPHHEFDLGQVQVALLDHFLRGVVTLPGHELLLRRQPTGPPAAAPAAPTALAA